MDITDNVSLLKDLYSHKKIEYVLDYGYGTFLDAFELFNHFPIKKYIGIDKKEGDYISALKSKCSSFNEEKENELAYLDSLNEYYDFYAREKGGKSKSFSNQIFESRIQTIHPAISFDMKFDLIVLSKILSHLDCQTQIGIISNLPNLLNTDGIVFLRVNSTGYKPSGAANDTIKRIYKEEDIKKLFVNMKEVFSDQPHVKHKKHHLYDCIIELTELVRIYQKIE